MTKWRVRNDEEGEMQRRSEGVRNDERNTR